MKYREGTNVGEFHQLRATTLRLCMLYLNA
jgi:hypothetical protein